MTTIGGGITVRRLMLCVACVGAIFGGLVLVSRSPTVRVQPATPPWFSNEDHNVLDVVLSDLIENPEFNQTKKPQVVFDLTTRRWVGSGSDFEEMVKEYGVALEVVQDLSRRNPARRLVTGYRPSNPNIVAYELGLYDDDPSVFWNAFPRASWYVRAPLPGYSADGLQAVFVFGFGPTPHGAGGHYVLKKVKGRWEVVRRYVWFMS
ncbi:MAG: hypothetical protein U0835_06485 [Isosphaeraceae bacterium]